MVPQMLRVNLALPKSALEGLNLSFYSRNKTEGSEICAYCKKNSTCSLSVTSNRICWCWKEGRKKKQVLVSVSTVSISWLKMLARLSRSLSEH